jgi:hypothetical protein
LASEQDRRNERARELGFRNDYDRRIRGSDVSRERPRGEELAQARGHRGAADFERVVQRGDIIFVETIPTEVNSLGQWSVVTVRVTFSDGREQTYRLRGDKDLNKDARMGWIEMLTDYNDEVDISDIYGVFAA